MEVKTITKEKNELEVEIIGEDHSLPNILREMIMQDPSVEFASYIIDHPKLGNPKLYIKTNGKKTAEKVLNDAVKKVRKEVSDLKTATKAVKKKK